MGVRFLLTIRRASSSVGLDQIDTGNASRVDFIKIDIVLNGSTSQVRLHSCGIGVRFVSLKCKTVVTIHPEKSFVEGSF